MRSTMLVLFLGVLTVALDTLTGPVVFLEGGLDLGMVLVGVAEGGVDLGR